MVAPGRLGEQACCRGEKAVEFLPWAQTQNFWTYSISGEQALQKQWEYCGGKFKGEGGKIREKKLFASQWTILVD